MRKDELVHLHNLLALVRQEFAERDDAPPGTFADYDALGVSPMAVYGSKTDHQRAVQELARALATAAEPESEPHSDAGSGSGSESGESGVRISSKR